MAAALQDQLEELRVRAARIVEHFNCIEGDKLAIALDVDEIDRKRLYRADNYSSLTAWAREAHGIPSSTITDARDVGRACRLAPELQVAMREGRVKYTAAVAIAPFAEAAEFPDWLAKAELLKIPELRAALACEAPTHERPIRKLSDDDAAWLDDAVQFIRAREQRTIPYKDALVMFVKLARTEGLIGKPDVPQVTIDYCPECKTATRPVNGGSVPISESLLAACRCDSSYVDLVHDDTGQIKRTVPAGIRRRVELRDRERCVVPGCKNRGTHLHHMDGWVNGHKVHRCFTLCYEHHQLAHEGVFTARGDMPHTQFFLRDGTFLGMAGDPLRADVAARKVTPAPELSCNSGYPESSPAASEAYDSALKALRVMQLGKKEAKEVLEAVMRQHPGRAWTADDLVGEALRSSTPRGIT